MKGQPVRTRLCVRVVIYDNSARLRDRMWKEIEGNTPRNDLTSRRLDHLHRVHYEKCVVTVRGQSMRK